MLKAAWYVSLAAILNAAKENLASALAKVRFCGKLLVINLEV
jgi:hypothetical protein